MTVRSNWRAARRAVLLALMAPMVLGAGCAKPPPPLPPPPPSPPTVLEVSVAVAADVNPDARGRASPLVARLFELKSLAAFDGADFFALSDQDKDSLGPDLVAKQALLLQPGEQRQFKRTLDPATRFVAVVAAYRDIERARWRSSMAVALNKTTPVTLSAQQRAITIGPAAGPGPGSEPEGSDPNAAKSSYLIGFQAVVPAQAGTYSTHVQRWHRFPPAQERRLNLTASGADRGAAVSPSAP